MRRSIERWQTKTFIHELMVSAGVGSVYALEDLMMRGQSELVFPADRPKLCDRMARCGEPALVKQIAPGGRRDLRTQKWFDRLIKLAPESVALLELAIWRLLDPQPLSHVEWHALGALHVKEAARCNHSLSAWMVTVEAGPWGDGRYCVPYKEGDLTRFALTSLLLGLRRWECQGDLLGYDIYFQELLNVAQFPSNHFSVQVLQPDLREYLIQVYGRVLIPYGAENLSAQHERVRLARQAWQQRVLIDSQVSA